MSEVAPNCWKKEIKEARQEKKRKKLSHVCQLRPGWTVERNLSLPGEPPLSWALSKSQPMASWHAGNPQIFLQIPLHVHLFSSPPPRMKSQPSSQPVVRLQERRTKQTAENRKGGMESGAERSGEERTDGADGADGAVDCGGGGSGVSLR